MLNIHQGVKVPVINKETDRASVTNDGAEESFGACLIDVLTGPFGNVGSAHTSFVVIAIRTYYIVDYGLSNGFIFSFSRLT